MTSFNEIFQKYDSETAIVTPDKSVSFQQLDQYVQEAQHRLKDRGVNPDDRVAIVSPNCFEYVVLLLGLWRIKAVACLLNTRESDEVIKRQAAELNCRCLISSKESLGGININDFIGKPDKISVSENVKLSLTQIATIMFTSGSSANPKAVVHSLGNHYYNAKGSNENIPVHPNDRWLLSLPLYHVSGLSIVFRTLLSGGTIVIPQPEENLTESIKKYSITHISLVSTQLIRLFQGTCIDVLKNLKAVLLGGGPIPERLIQQAQQHPLPLHITYGLTETASQMATGRPNSVKVLNCRQIKIAPDHEILVKGETLFQGYWENGKVITPFTADGWFQTGDLGYLDKEGCLTVTGRKDNMFISGGENIHPEEIERQLLSIEDIEQAVVIPIKDEEFGLCPAAFIKTQDGKDISEEDITDCLKERLASFKIPRHFYPWPTQIEAGIKINRKKMKDTFPLIM